MDFPARPKLPLPVGISACLAGQAVRYDGSDAAASLPGDALRGRLRLCGICPEMGIGMGAPRPPIRLVDSVGGPRALRVDRPSEDFTDALCAFADAQAAFLDQVFGFIFMERSPSCGLASVKVRAQVRGAPLRLDGRGVFARRVVESRPELPVEENGRLRDPDRRNAFLTQVVTFAHWRRLLAGGLTKQRLLEFHARHKYLLMAHSPAHYRRCGRLLSDLRGDFAAAGGRYFASLMEGLRRPATAAGHGNALAHMQGYFRGRLAKAETARLAQVVERCRLGVAPVDDARACLQELLERHPLPYLQKQLYLERTPPPEALRVAGLETLKGREI